MKRIFIFLLIFFSTYGMAYWWGVYDLRFNPPKIKNDGDLATLGMMPVYLLLYGISWGVTISTCYLIAAFIKKLFHKSIKFS